MGILGSILGALGNNTVGQSALPINGPMTDTSQGGGLLGGDPSMSAQGGGAMGAGNTSGGLFGAGGLLDFSDPKKLMALQLIANGSRPPGEMLNGLPQIAAYGQRMQQDRQERAAADRDRRDKLAQGTRTDEWIRQHRPDLAQFIGVVPTAELIKEAWKPTSSKDDYINVGGNLYNTKTNDWLSPPGGDEQGDEFYGTPVYVRDPETGQMRVGQLSKTGNFKAVDTNGLSVEPGIRTVDTGTGTAIVDRGGQQTGFIEKDIAGANRQQEIGTAEGKAAAAASGDLQAGENALALIEDLRNDPNRERGTGLSGWLFNSVPATAGYDYQNKVDQAKSGAFLTAIQQMRGLGALSNAEGGAATAAITRMNTATSEEAFSSALDDYEKIIRQGIDRAKGRLGTGSQGQDIGGVARPTTEAEYNALPSGATFVDPDDGKTYRKP